MGLSGEGYDSTFDVLIHACPLKRYFWNFSHFLQASSDYALRFVSSRVQIDQETPQDCSRARLYIWLAIVKPSNSNNVDYGSDFVKMTLLFPITLEFLL